VSPSSCFACLSVFITIFFIILLFTFSHFSIVSSFNFYSFSCSVFFSYLIHSFCLSHFCLPLTSPFLRVLILILLQELLNRKSAYCLI
jgi:hypothetical protein